MKASGNVLQAKVFRRIKPRSKLTAGSHTKETNPIHEQSHKIEACVLQKQESRAGSSTSAEPHSCHEEGWILDTWSSTAAKHLSIY